MASSNFITIDETTPKEFNKRKDIFNFGVDNDYPTNIKKLINSSVTAKSCANLIGSFLYGKGFDNNGFYINRDGDTPNKLLRKTTVDASYYNGFAIHIGYNALGEKTSFKVIPFEWVRKAQEDNNGYISKLKVSKDWSDRKVEPIEYDIYNPSQALNQINRDTIEAYKGQILYVSFSYQDIYPKSWIDPVIDDCISEWKSSVYKKNLITKGFMKNSIVVTKEFDNDKSKANFQKGMKSQLGADGVGGINHYEADLDSDDLSQEVFIQDVGTDLNDQLFKYTDKNVSDKICIAYGVAPSLIKNDDNSLFSGGGDAIEQMMLNVQFRVDNIKRDIEDTFRDLFTGTVNSELNSAEFIINPLVVKTEEIKKEENGAIDN